MIALEFDNKINAYVARSYADYNGNGFPCWKTARAFKNQGDCILFCEWLRMNESLVDQYVKTYDRTRVVTTIRKIANQFHPWKLTTETI